MSKQEIKLRTILGSPLEQLKEAGRSIKNLTSFEHYKAISKFIHARKKGIPCLDKDEILNLRFSYFKLK